MLFGFWRGQRLREIEPRLKPGGKYEMATLELREGDTIKPAVATRLAREAVALNRTLGDPTKVVKAGAGAGSESAKRCDAGRAFSARSVADPTLLCARYRSAPPRPPEKKSQNNPMKVNDFAPRFSGGAERGGERWRDASPVRVTPARSGRRRGGCREAERVCTTSPTVSPPPRICGSTISAASRPAARSRAFGDDESHFLDRPAPYAPFGCHDRTDRTGMFRWQGRRVKSSVNTSACCSASGAASGLPGSNPGSSRAANTRWQRWTFAKA